MKTAIQIDFDGTVTIEDVSFLLLDKYVGQKWRDELAHYSSGQIPVGAFNRRVFGMMKASRKAMTDFVLTDPRVQIRRGFKELLEYCGNKGFKIVIVSNGLLFYIQAILKKLGLEKIKGMEIYAAKNDFFKGGVKVAYMGPDGQEVEAGFKEAYTDLLKKEDYCVIYVGDGDSDIFSAHKADRVFATAQLLKRCRAEKLECTPFEDFFEVIKELQSLENVRK